MTTTRTESTRKATAREGNAAATSRKDVMVGQLTEELERAPQPLLEATRDVLRVSRDSVKYAILTRWLSLARRVMEDVSTNILVEAIAASTDKEAMLRVLEAPEMASPTDDAATIVAARAAGIEARDQLLAAQGGAWPVERAAKFMGLTRQAVDKRRKANKLIGLAIGRHGFVYPAWQFSRTGTLPGLEDVLHALRRHDAWSQVIFMLSPNDRLDGSTPLEVLRQGRVEEVKSAASLFGEHGAV